MAEDINLFDNLNDIKVAEPVSLTFDFEYTPAEIKIQGKEELEKALKDYVEKYSGYVVTAETFEDDAKVRASLNKLEKQVKGAVKKKLAEYNKPLDDINNWLDNILEPISKINSDIDEGVKKFEELERQKRADTIKVTFEEVIETSGAEVDIRLFESYFDELSKKTCFMVDNIRVNKATKGIITELVADEVTKKEKRDQALILISEAAAKADFGPAPYINHFERGAELANILQAIADDKTLADKVREEKKRKRELSKRIEEMTAIANSKGLKPEKYARMLEAGESPLEVHENLVNDATEIVKRQQEQAIQAEFPKKQVELAHETEQPINYTTEQENVSQVKPRLNKTAVKWQGDFKITFPDMEIAKLFGGKGGLYEQYGITVEKLGEWVKIK